MRSIEIYISKFLTFVGLLSLKCNVCLTFVKTEKGKIRQMLHGSHCDVICARCVFSTNSDGDCRCIDKEFLQQAVGIITIG